MSYDPDEGYDTMPYAAFACLECGAIVHDTDIHDTWHHNQP